MYSFVGSVGLSGQFVRVSKQLAIKLHFSYSELAELICLSSAHVKVSLP